MSVGALQPPADSAELAALQARLAACEAELALARQDAEHFVRMVSHDLRAPLRHVLAYSGLLREMLAGGEDPATALGTLERSSRQLGEMLDAVVALAELARAPLHMASTPGALLVDEARRAALALLPATDRARAIDWHVAPGLPPVPGDAAQLRQALAALLANAVKFTRPAVAPRIEIGAEAADGGSVRICVRDNGVGFDPAQAARLFQPFVRLHGSRFEGLGTGLAAVRQIAQRHGGSVRAEAVAGQGCAVWMELPNRPAITPGSAEAASGTSPASG